MYRSYLPSILCAVLLLTLFIQGAQGASDDHTVLRGAEASEQIDGTELLRFSYEREIPSFVRFRPGQGISPEDLELWLKKHFELPEGFALQEIRRKRDRLGWEHIRYRQMNTSVPFLGGEYILHIKNGEVRKMNGILFSGEIESAPSLSKEDARQVALDEVGADTYKWEHEGSEKWLQDFTGNPDTSYFPEGKLLIVPSEGNIQEDDPRLAYEFDIYAHQPISRAKYYVDAATGEFLFDDPIIHHADDTGTAVTGYSSSQTIVADSVDPNTWRLRESGRGGGVETYNMQQGTDYNNAVDFTDDDNYWNNANAQVDEYAGDAHWGAEMTYDYFWDKFNRNSIDDAGFPLLSYVHYDVDFGNAFWDGQRMTYGDGSSGNAPLTALDICAHEVSHGLTSNTADLVYQDESGALNESFSDIFGNAVEYFAKPAGADWEVGEDIGGIRDMSDPGLYGDPDTYFGNDWYTGTGDNGGVHINSGVQNFWFYLMVEGGTGTNDLGDSYNVTAVGWDTAGAIAYRNLVHYLGSGSEYDDARFYAIQSAIDLYGACSQAHESTTDAWYAVGIGAPFNPNVVSDFEAIQDSSCLIPFDTEFQPLTNSASSFKWYFGDGDSSSSTAPSHTYDSAGTYDVTLLVSGGCGNDTTVKTGMIQLEPVEFSALGHDTVCEGQEALLSADSDSDFELEWFDSPSGGTALDTQDQYSTPPITSNTDYYVQLLPPLRNVGPVDNNFGNGSNFNYDQYLVFDCYTSVILESVKVYASGGGYRTIQLRNSSGSILESDMIYIQDGEHRVQLDFNIPTGEDLQLGVDGAGADLYRNSSGANYPYVLDNMLEIKHSSASSDPYSYYYFFYDWEVRGPDCESGREKVSAIVEDCTGLNEKEEDAFAFQVRPNPSKGRFVLEGDFAENGTRIEVTDSYGRLIERVAEIKSDRYELDLSDRASGIYFLRIAGDEKSRVERLVIER